MTDRKVHGDAMQPGVHRTSAFKRSQFSESQGETFLRQIFSIFAISHHGVHRAVNSLLVPSHDDSIGVPFALQNAANNVTFIDFGGTY